MLAGWLNSAWEIGYGLAALLAGLARNDCKLKLKRHPTDRDPAHVHVIGTKTDSVRRKLRKGSTVLVEPAHP